MLVPEENITGKPKHQEIINNIPKSENWRNGKTQEQILEHQDQENIYTQDTGPHC